MNMLCKLQIATESLVLLLKGWLVWLETDEACKALEAEWGTRTRGVGTTGRDWGKLLPSPLAPTFSLFFFWFYQGLTREGTRQWGQQSKQARALGCLQRGQKAGRP